MTSVTRGDMSRFSPRDRRDAPLKGRHACHDPSACCPFAVQGRSNCTGGRALQSMVDRLVPVIAAVIVRLLPIIGRTRNRSTQSSSEQLPTIDEKLPTIGSSVLAAAEDRQDGADSRQDRADDRQVRSTDQQSAFDRFNDRHRATGTGIEAQPIEEPTITVDGPTAAIAFVLRWVAEHDLVREWQVDDLWHIASEDFALAHGLILPPRRVFLSALKKTPGVICTSNRRVYDRNGRLLWKTTFYRLAELPVDTSEKTEDAVVPIKRAA